MAVTAIGSKLLHCAKAIRQRYRYKLVKYPILSPSHFLSLDRDRMYKCSICAYRYQKQSAGILCTNKFTVTSIDFRTKFNVSNILSVSLQKLYLVNSGDENAYVCMDGEFQAIYCANMRFYIVKMSKFIVRKSLRTVIFLY